MPLPPRYAEGTENSFLETAFRKTSFMEHYPILQKQLLFGSSSCFGSFEQNVFVLLNDKSRMKGDLHVRFREKFEVKVLLLTRLEGEGQISPIRSVSQACRCGKRAAEGRRYSPHDAGNCGDASRGMRNRGYRR